MSYKASDARFDGHLDRTLLEADSMRADMPVHKCAVWLRRS
jgi:hypothetical protein